MQQDRIVAGELICQCFSPRSPVPSLHVMPEARHRSTPRVMAALAGVVHDRQTAASHGRSAEDNQQGGLHVRPRYCGLAGASRSPTYPGPNEPTVDAPETGNPVICITLGADRGGSYKKPGGPRRTLHPPRPCVAGAALQATALGMPRPQPYTRTFKTPSNRLGPLKNAAAPAGKVGGDALGLVVGEQLGCRTAA